MGLFSRIIKAPFEIAKDIIEDIKEVITGDEEDQDD